MAFSPGPGAEPCIFTGRTRGRIKHTYNEEAARNLAGFGWDAIFVPDPATIVSETLAPDQERTFAEMSIEEKNAISHRGRALRQFSIFLQENEDWVYGRAEKRRAEPEPTAPPSDVFSFRRRRRML